MREDHDVSFSLSNDCQDGDPFPADRSSDPGLVAIGEVARTFGVTPRALRLYEAKGLLSPARLSAVRLYGPVERQRLALLLKAKKLGFTLAEIRRMVAASDEAEGAGSLHISRRQCFEQIKFLEQRRREIEAALAELRRTYTTFYVRLVQPPA